MRYLTYILLSIFIFGCNNQKKSAQEKLREEVENIVIPNLNDPRSYEFVSLKVDTLNREIINNRIKDIKKFLNNYKKDKIKNKLMIEELEDQLQASLAIQYPSNKMEYLLKYRGKNAFNATILKEEIVVTDLKSNFVEMYEKSR